MNELTGKVALVTGGGRGLGEAICRMLGTEGAIAIVADIREELAETIALEIQADGGKAKAIRLDVCDEHQVEAAVAEIVSEFGRLDILINNAGTDVTLPVDELTIAEWDRVLAVNLRAPFVLSKQVLPTMQQQKRGHIINIASTASKRAWANASAYHASKWGLLGFSHALHVEARPHGIKVTAVLAGGMQTPFILDRFPDTPLEKLQDPKNVADTIRYVLSQPEATVIPEVMVLPMQESSWP
ncbi:SDR family oxidoreductase [Leptolyngbya sp. FACHB-321]|uniref:SDR family oxidoreductase n=1 Tax=Leptolyngbya sp. FACHB-321 TaxID=2692807 RepID=UPI0016826EDA|nr:SDR family oxidoreductase [Leptolyngbya sp. FACHB-321]MBD2034646.1 SDR family oxidoreductase [Leptolyngbya sp. FACHB-321]